jgi:hypothetical protein
MLLFGIWRLYDIAPFLGNQRRVIVRMDTNNGTRQSIGLAP